MSPSDECDGVDNAVFLRGRMGGLPATRELPSGDMLMSFRVTVARRPPGRVKVDSVDCVTVRARVRRTLERAQPGDLLEVRGALHRRFWRSPAGPTSRYAVDVESVRLTRAGRRGGA